MEQTKSTKKQAWIYTAHKETSNEVEKTKTRKQTKAVCFADGPCSTACRNKDMDLHPEGADAAR